MSGLSLNEVKEVIELAVEAGVAPVSERVGRVEEKLNELVDARVRRREAVWKIATLIVATPACLYALLSLI